MAGVTGRTAWLRRVGWVIVFAAVFVGLRTWQQRGLASGAAPPLSAKTLAGASYALSRNRDSPTVVYFWAGWCPVCRLEHGAISELADDGRVITVAMQSGSDAEVRRYLDTEKLRWPVINDPQGDLARAWNVRATPAFFIVDRRAMIRFREVGYTSGVGLRLRLWLADHFQSKE
jgi:thiol-disulfide isomerase/thioredoxin